MAPFPYKYSLMIYNYRLKHKRMTQGLPWVKDDDSKDIPAVLQISKTIKQVDAFKELAQAEKDEKYKAWDKSKGETGIEEKVGDPLAVKLYKSVVLKQKETRQKIRNIGEMERKKLTTFRNKFAKIGINDRENWLGNDGLKEYKKIFTDWDSPDTTHELYVRYFSQLIDDYFEIWNKVSSKKGDTKKVDNLYSRKMLELFDYLLGRKDKVPEIIKRRNLAQLEPEPQASSETVANF